MKSLQQLPLPGICLTLLLSGCNRDIPIPPTDETPPTGNVQTVTFKLSGFESEISPLDDRPSRTQMAFGRFQGSMHALKGVEPSLEPQYLYYWSFNDQTLEPDIAVDEMRAGITFEASDTEPGFINSTLGSDLFIAGRALSIKGARSLIIHLPMTAVESLTDFAFSINSSDTGPKDFSIAFSIDGGTTYEVLSASNQFENLGNSQRNYYAFDISSFSEFIGVEMLQFKVDFLPGNRPPRSPGDGEEPGVHEYNASQGTVRIDNVRLSGVYNTEVETGDPSAPNKLHYYVFSAADGSLVTDNEVPIGDLGADGVLEVKLEAGVYDVLFAAHRSDKGILLPETLTNAEAFYFGQHFDDHRAITYAVVLEDFEVGDSDREASAVLKRCYSLVEFDFTDLGEDLLAVKKIVVTKHHDNYLYAPFGTPVGSPVSDAQSITFSGFAAIADYRVALHQFFGLLDRPYDISYELTAYGDGDEVLNVVTISAAVTNNVRLLLTGRLLGNTGAINGFAVELETDWDDTMVQDF